ncbi:sporulation initiation phosphotransferase Spo0F [soil metagenome]
MSNKILIIDDNKFLRFTLSALLEDSGFSPFTAADPEKAIKEINSKHPDLIILDKKLSGSDGFDLLPELKRINKDVPVILLTAYADPQTEQQALKLGADAFVSKPFDNDDFIDVIRGLLDAAVH